MTEKTRKKIPTIGRIIATAYRTPNVIMPYSCTKRSWSMGQGMIFSKKSVT